MSKNKDTKVLCEECNWHGELSDVKELHYSHNDTEMIALICPSCCELNHLFPVCDEPDCWRMVTCGFQTEAGYRTTCSKHYQEIHRRKETT